MKKTVVFLLLATSMTFLMSNLLTANEASQEKPIIAQYFGIFDYKPSDQAWKDLLATAPFEKANRFYIAFTLLRNGEIALEKPEKGDGQKIKELVSKIRGKNPNAEILISTGYDDGTMYMEAAKDPEKFAQSVVSFIKEYKLNGYDMDWENGIEPTAMLNLAKAIHKAFEPEDYIFTMALWQATSERNFNKYKNEIGEIAKYVDQINIMTYGNGRTVTESAKEYNKYGVPYSKLLGGIEVESGYGEVNGIDTLGKNGTIREKCDEAKELGMAGMMSWRMDNDYRIIDKNDDDYGKTTFKGTDNLYKWMTYKPSLWDRIISIF